MNRQQPPRIPATCPPGFLGRYTVIPGDTMYSIAQSLGIGLNVLIGANPHIPDPNILFPGDVLCVPGLISFPCCVVLNIQRRLPFGSGGAAFVNFGIGGRQTVSIVATLPPPSTFGNFDVYLGEVFITGLGGFDTRLSQVPGNPSTYAGRIDLPPAAELRPDSPVVVRAFNTVTRISGPVVLLGNLATCL